MSLPIIVIFERHWDVIAKQATQSLVGALKDEGYDSLAIEAPQDVTTAGYLSGVTRRLQESQTILRDAERLLTARKIKLVQKLADVSYSKLVELMRLFVSSKMYVEVAQRIKELPAHELEKPFYEHVIKSGMTLHGVDINHEHFNELFEGKLSENVKKIDASMDLRDETCFLNLMKIQKKAAGIIFVVGAAHADGIIKRFQKYNMSQNVLYYFPHSQYRYDDSIDDIQYSVNLCKTLQGHTCLLTEGQVPAFTKKVVDDLQTKIQYVKEVEEGNSHTKRLSSVFKTKCKAFLRPGYYVDAVMGLEENPNLEAIKKGLASVNIPYRETTILGKKYVVVAKVNTSFIADKILQLPL